MTITKGRPREFDISEALDRALFVFWQKGYRGTSLDDLTDAMRINRPSLYSAFGDKEQLFLEAVKHYRDNYLRPLTLKLLEAKNLQEGLTQYFRDIGNLVANEKKPTGCLIACLLSEECCDSPIIKETLAQAIDSSDQIFEQIFQKHRNALAPGIEPAEAAKMLVTTLHGTSIRARSGGSKRSLQGIAETFMKLVLKKPSLK